MQALPGRFYTPADTVAGAAEAAAWRCRIAVRDGGAGMRVRWPPHREPTKGYEPKVLMDGALWSTGVLIIIRPNQGGYRR